VHVAEKVIFHKGVPGAVGDGVPVENINLIRQ
jgi:hypothetical protein